MFDLSKLGDMAKIASEAKSMQEKQELVQMGVDEVFTPGIGTLVDVVEYIINV